MQSYALISAVRNEAEHIERTIQAVLHQDVKPVQWVIASDGSRDGTDDIVASYSERYPFIVLVRVEGDVGRNFASKVRALHAAESALEGIPYDCIANLDGDIAFDRTYFSTLLSRLRDNPRLGIVGGWIHEDYGHGFVPRRQNLSTMVPHAVQCVRRACYQDIGGYVPMPYGGEDTYAVVTALMRDWQVRAFDDLPVRHYRRTASAGSILQNRFRQGRADYSLGYAPWFEVLKCVRRLLDPPFGIGAAVWMAGFIWGYVLTETRPVSPEVIAFVRSQQRDRLARRRRTVPARRSEPTEG